MSDAGAVLDLHAVRSKHFDPSRYLSLGALEIQEPLQSTVVCPDCEGLSVQVVVKVFHGLNHSKKFFPGHAVTALGLREGLTEVRDRPLLASLHLGQG